MKDFVVVTLNKLFVAYAVEGMVSVALSNNRHCFFFQLVLSLHTIFHWRKRFGPGVVACTCNPATLEAKSWNSPTSISVGHNIPSIGGWIV